MTSKTAEGRDADMLVRLEDVCVAGAGQARVENVSLSIRRGDIVCLIGPNGSGKSTTAKVVTGVLKPTTGSVWRAPGIRIGYVPQRLNVDWTMPLSVQRLLTLTGRQDGAKIAHALERVGLKGLEHRDVQTLSGGQFQRALLARALVRAPDLMVLDEPVQGVDYAGESALYDLISSIRSEIGCGILMISHDLHVVMAETDSVICLNGHVCCSGTPESVAASAEYMNLFGSRARSHLALYRHEHDHVHLPDGRVRLSDGTIVEDGDPRHPHNGEHQKSAPHHGDHSHV